MALVAAFERPARASPPRVGRDHRGLVRLHGGAAAVHRLRVDAGTALGHEAQGARARRTLGCAAGGWGGGRHLRRGAERVGRGGASQGRDGQRSTYLRRTWSRLMARRTFSTERDVN